MMPARREHPIDSVLLIGFGGPDHPDQIMPFLARVTQGRGIPRARLLEAARHYEAVGGRSPYTPQTRMLAASLETSLAGQGFPIPVRVGMRNSEPFLADAVADLAGAGKKHAAGLILAPHRSEVSWDRYMKDVSSSIEAAGVELQVTYLEPWFDDPGFIEACVARIEEVSDRRRGAWPPDLPVIFTAHSIPVSLAERSPYLADIRTSCRLVARQLVASDWEIAFQSRSGDPATPWLEPDIRDALRARAGKGVREAVVLAIGFLSDHVEVLYDLDIEAADVAREVGITIKRAPGVIDHPAFVSMLGRRIRATIRSVEHSL